MPHNARFPFCGVITLRLRLVGCQSWFDHYYNLLPTCAVWRAANGVHLDQSSVIKAVPNQCVPSMDKRSELTADPRSLPVASGDTNYSRACVRTKQLLQN